jgi:hypothetical protein
MVAKRVEVSAAVRERKRETETSKSPRAFPNIVETYLNRKMNPPLVGSPTPLGGMETYPRTCSVRDDHDALSSIHKLFLFHNIELVAIFRAFGHAESIRLLFRRRAVESSNVAKLPRLFVPDDSSRSTSQLGNLKRLDS